MVIIGFISLYPASDKSKVQRNKMATAGEEIEYRCLVRATDGKKNISTLVTTLTLLYYISLISLDCKVFYCLSFFLVQDKTIGFLPFHSFGLLTMHSYSAIPVSAYLICHRCLFRLSQTLDMVQKKQRHRLIDIMYSLHP